MDSFFFGPHQTPNSIKKIITLIVAVSLLAPVITFFSHILHMKGPMDFLPLTLAHMKEGYIFELITYPLIHSTSEAITFSLLWSLAFHMFLLWFVGSELLLRLKTKKFFFLLISATVIPASVFFLFQLWFKEPTLLYGTMLPLTSLLTVLALEVGALEVRLFLFFRFALRNLIFLLLGLLLLIDLSHGEFSLFFAKATAIAWGACIARISLKLPLPFRKKTSCDIIEVSEWQSSPEDTFVDQMLDKIAKKGRGSLSEKERNRLDEIMKKRGH